MMKEIRVKINGLVKENKYLRALNKEQQRIIDELMYKVEQLEGDLEYANVHGGLKGLVLRKKNQ